MSPPSRIGRYDVERLLGRGAMGEVMLARDTVLGRQVAIKMLRRDLGLTPEMTASLEARMRQEARAVASVSHPNLVTLHDMGEDPERGLYLVFELVEGTTLRARLDDGPLSPEQAEQLARELAGALDRVHAAGVIHRDVKPDNVMLTSNGAKLTDFGIARLPDSTLTRAGGVLGTPAYSAPEALAQGEFSARSDQFSLGATLYEAIRGARPFPGEDAIAVAQCIALDEPSPLRQGPSGPELPAIGGVLGRAMAKEPSKRFTSCTDLAEAMNVAVYGGVEVPRVSIPPASILPPSRKRVQNIVAAAALLTIVGLLAFGRHPAPVEPAVSDNDGLRGVASSFSSATEARKPPVHGATPGGSNRRIEPRPSGRPADDDAGGLSAPAESGSAGGAKLDARPD